MIKLITCKSKTFKILKYILQTNKFKRFGKEIKFRKQIHLLVPIPLLESPTPGYSTTYVCTCGSYLK